MKTTAMTAQIIDRIRQGESVTLYPGSVRNQRKLWDWCRKHSEDGRVNVTVLRSSDYGIMRDEKRVRQGRAHAEIRVRPRYDWNTERNVIHYSDIVWSYVY